MLDNLVAEVKIVNKKTVLINVFIGILLSLFVLNIISLAYNKTTFFHSLTAFPINWVFMILFFLFLDLIIQSIRLILMTSLLKRRIGFLQAFEVIFFGNYFSFVTPMALGGQPFQIIMLNNLGLEWHLSTNIVLVRTWISLLNNLTIAFIGIPFLLNILTHKTKILPVIFGFVIVFIGTIITIVPFLTNNKKLKRGAQKLFNLLTQKISEEKIESFFQWLKKVKESVQYVFFKKPSILITDYILGMIAILIQSIPLKIAIEVVNTTQTSLNIFSFTAIMVTLNTAALYIPTPGASGGIETFYQIVFSNFYTLESTLIGTTVYRFLTYYLIIFIGTLFVFRLKYLFQ